MGIGFGAGLGVAASAAAAAVPILQIQLRGDAGVYEDDAATDPAEASDLVQRWNDTDTGQASSWYDVGATYPTLVTADADFNGHDILYFFTGGSLQSSLTGMSAAVSHTFFWVIYFGALTADAHLFDSPNLTIWANDSASKLGFQDSTALRSASTSPPTSATTVLALVLDAVGGTGQFYQAGSAVGGSLTYDKLSTITGTCALMDSVTTDGGNNAWLGEFRWYDEAKSAAEVATITTALEVTY